MTPKLGRQQLGPKYQIQFYKRSQPQDFIIGTLVAAVKFKRNEERSEKKYLLTSRWRTVSREAVAAAAAWFWHHKRRFVEFYDIQSIYFCWNLLLVLTVTSQVLTRLKAHAGFFRLINNGIFNTYVLWPLDEKLIFYLVTRVKTRSYTKYAFQMV